MQEQTKKSFFFIILVFSLLNFLNINLTLSQSISTDSIVKTKSKISLDFSLTPTIVFNSANIGIGYIGKRNIEYTILVGCRYIPFYFFNLNLNLNTNIYFRKTLYYFPIWLRCSNARNDYGYGEKPHSLRFSIGSGIGNKSFVYKKILTRIEFGLGVSYWLYSNKGRMLSNYHLSDYKNNSYYGNVRRPNFIPAIKFKLTFTKSLIIH